MACRVVDLSAAQLQTFGFLSGIGKSVVTLVVGSGGTYARGGKIVIRSDREFCFPRSKNIAIRTI